MKRRFGGKKKKKRLRSGKFLPFCTLALSLYFCPVLKYWGDKWHRKKEDAFLPHPPSAFPCLEQKLPGRVCVSWPPSAFGDLKVISFEAFIIITPSLSQKRGSQGLCMHLGLLLSLCGGKGQAEISHVKGNTSSSLLKQHISAPISDWRCSCWKDTQKHVIK